MIRPGSIVLIDTQKRTIASRREWTHEFDRPIYFLITRNGYASGFCELDRDADWLTLEHFRVRCIVIPGETLRQTDDGEIVWRRSASQVAGGP